MIRENWKWRAVRQVQFEILDIVSLMIDKDMHRILWAQQSFSDGSFNIENCCYA